MIHTLREYQLASVKMRAAIVFILGLAAVLATPEHDPIDVQVNPRGQRIIGGSVTTINAYPFGVALLASSSGSNHRQACGGSIINNRSVLSAAHCFHLLRNNDQWRSRVGSTNANSGGSVFNTNRIIRHPQYNPSNEDNDFAVVRIQGAFVWGDSVRAASIAGANYNLADNQVVWAIGWGHTSWGGSPSEELRHVQIWTINQNVCNQRYFGRITQNMLCSGWLDVGGRDQCQGDSGGPLIHDTHVQVIVGVSSWVAQCAHPFFPGVNARVSRASQWIVSNA